MAATGVPKSHEVDPMTFMDLATKRVLKITSDPERTEDALKDMGVDSVSWTGRDGFTYTVNHAHKDMQDPFINVNRSIRRGERLVPIDSMVWDPADPTDRAKQKTSKLDGDLVQREGFNDIDQERIINIILAVELRN